MFPLWRSTSMIYCSSKYKKKVSSTPLPVKHCPLFHWLLGSSCLNDNSPWWIIQKFMATFFRIDLRPGIILFYCHPYLLSPNFIMTYAPKATLKMWVINKGAYLRYSLWDRLKLVCPLDLIVFLLNVLALPLRNKWKHMCKTNHSLSFQICHELLDQRQLREATFQTGPQRSLIQASLSGARKDRFP